MSKGLIPAAYPHLIGHTCGTHVINREAVLIVAKLSGHSQLYADTLMARMLQAYSTAYPHGKTS